jgi:small ligand-binding sensory domain FIST
MSHAATRARFAAALSTQADTAKAIDQVAAHIKLALAEAPDLVLVFVSQQHGPDYGAIAARLCQQLGSENLLGSTGESIVGGDREVEEAAALAVWAARLPATSLRLMHLEFARTGEGGSIVGWPDDMPESWPAGAALVVLGEPYTFPTDVLLERINEDQPGIPVVGGMASGGHGPGQNKLLLGRRQVDAGAVAALVHGGVRVRTVVSQGCRPIGQPYVITKADRNLILELGGKPALVQLRELFPTLSDRERQLVQQGLHVGRVVNEYQDRFEPGDFLVRNVIGGDQTSGAIAIGDYVRVGQTVQFHVRDAATADDDLGELLKQTASAGASPAGGLLFTCNGRGTRLFDAPNHDAGRVQQAFANLPLAGFFAQGEIGPVGGRNFVHGFTASLVLFEDQPS